MKPSDSRDRGLDALLHRQAYDWEPSAECLDAEMLAAWAEGGLEPQSRQAAERHAASCARCRSLLATIVNTEPEPPTASPTLWERLGVRWLVPLTAAAAAVALWAIVPQQQSPTPAGELARVEPASAPGTAPSAPASNEEATRPPELKDEEARLQRSANAPAEAGRSEQAGGSASSNERDRADTPAPTEPSRDAADADARQQLEKSLNAEAPPAAAQQQAKLAEAADAAGVTPAAEPPARFAAPSAPATPPGASGAADQGAARREASAIDQQSAVITTADPMSRWRVAGAGVIEHSTDGGASWERLALGTAARITAGSAPSVTVCWLVGPGGLVLRTTDARTWQRLPAPTTEDLADVQATSDRAATVRTASGAAFQTTDGGASWTPVR